MRFLVAAANAAPEVERESEKVERFYLINAWEYLTAVARGLRSSSPPPSSRSPLLTRAASLDSIFQLEWDKREGGRRAGVEDGWVELATLLRLKRTPKLAQSELLWDV